MSEFKNFNMIFPPPFLQYCLRLQGKLITRSQKTDWNHWWYYKFCLAKTWITCYVTATGYSFFSRWIYWCNSKITLFEQTISEFLAAETKCYFFCFYHPTAVSRLESSTWKYYPEWENQDLALRLHVCSWNLSVHMCMYWYCNGIQK